MKDLREILIPIAVASELLVELAKIFCECNNLDDAECIFEQLEGMEIEGIFKRGRG